MNDAELVQQALAGDVESFGQLVNRHRGAVQGLAYHWVGSFENAEDIVQETLVTAYLKLGQLRNPNVSVPGCINSPSIIAGSGGKNNKIVRPWRRWRN